MPKFLACVRDLLIVLVLGAILVNAWIGKVDPPPAPTCPCGATAK